MGATDAGGLGAAQGFTLMARANSSPVVPSVPAQQSIAVGATYQYDLKATDSEGDLLSYSLVQGSSGMRVTASVFVKNPERVEAIAMIVGLSLLVYNLAQRKLRQQLEVVQGRAKN